jgi:hypothetical protein
MIDTDKIVARGVLRAAVQKTIFCPVSGGILDVKTSVLVEARHRETGKGFTSLTVSAEVYDSTVKRNIEATTGSLAYAVVTVYDGRELFA